MDSRAGRRTARLVWRDGDLQPADVGHSESRARRSFGLALFGVDPGSSDKGWAVAVCTATARPHVRLQQMPIADLGVLVDELCVAAESNHVLLSLDAPLRAFGGVQAPESFAPQGAVSGTRAWPFNVNAFAQRPCEKALGSKPPDTPSLPAAELRTALAKLCRSGDDCPAFVTRHPGVSVLGYMGAPHAPVIRTFLDALVRRADECGLRIASDPAFRQQDAGVITVFESHPAVSLGFYASAGVAGFPRTVNKYKPWSQNHEAFDALAEAVGSHLLSVHAADLECSIASDDDLDAVVGLMNLLDLAGGTGDLFGTAEEGYFLVPRVTRTRSFLDIWRSVRTQVVGESLPTTAAGQLAAYIEGLDEFRMVEELALPYNHMGATITDAVLQAGLRYETVVWPRVQHVMEAYPEAARQTSGFLTTLRERGGEDVVNWTHAEKLGRMDAVAELFVAQGVETESDLRAWLCGDGPDCREHVAKLAQVRGMGPKTIDYFKILCGEQDTAAVDVHLTRFLEQAGIRVAGYEQARDAIADAASELGVTAAQLDHSIWTYMSKVGRTW